jgi:ParB family chromosome partitioning protein
MENNNSSNNNKKRALGRGLESLFNDENLDIDNIEKQIYDSADKEEIQDIDVNDLRPNPYQPRKTFDQDALNELASSIKEHGIFQPLIVKKSIKGYEIIAGERRFRAAKMAGLTKVPAIIRQFSDEQMMEIALLENLQRENLNTIEEALAYKSMIDHLGITQDEVASKVGKSRSYITNMLGILTLPKEIQDMVVSGELTMGHARVLSKLEDTEKIMYLAHKVVDEAITVRELEDLANGDTYKRKNEVIRTKADNPYKYVEDILRDKLDTKVKITNDKVTISFTSAADLNRILEVLNIKE